MERDWQSAIALPVSVREGLERLDDQPLQDVLPLKSGQYTPDATALKRLYNAFMGTVQHAADLVDRR